MLRSAATLATLALWLNADAANAVTVTITNMCSTSISLFDNSAVAALAAGASTTRTLTPGYVGMFRDGAGEQATLAEFSVDAGTGRPWYDISIIPPGPGNCESLAACKAVTGKVGYNTAMSITPLNNAGVDTCNSLVCLADGCADAYLYPADDTKTHTCPAGTDFALTFCPGGTGGATPAPTPSPTPAPVTQAPTPSPTPSVSPTAVKTSSASRDINGELVSSEYDTGSTGFSLASSSSSSVQDKSTDSDATTTVEPSAGTSTSSSSVATTTDSSTPTTSTTATGSNGSGGVVEVSTQSSASSGSTVGILLAMVVVVVGAAAGGVIYAVRKKKQRLDMEAKSPLPTTTHDAMSRELAIFMATP